MALDGLNYWVSILLMMLGFFGVVSSVNLVKKLISLMILQVSVLLFYISIGYVKSVLVPTPNPITQVLVLTAIVVGVAVMAVGLAIIVRIKEEYGTIEEDEIEEINLKKHKRESKKK